MFATRSFIRAIVPVVKTHHKRGLGNFTRTFIFSHVYSSPQRVISRDVGHRIPKKSPVRKDDSVLANEAIPYSEMRVVYQDDRTEKSRWKIMKRMEAIDFARSQSLDLVVGEFSLLVYFFVVVCYDTSCTSYYSEAPHQ